MAISKINLVLLHCELIKGARGRPCQPTGQCPVLQRGRNVSFLFYFMFRAAPEAYGRSQARGQSMP